MAAHLELGVAFRYKILGKRGRHVINLAQDVVA
jgi:hypothetical protein